MNRVGSLATLPTTPVCHCLWDPCGCCLASEIWWSPKGLGLVPGTQHSGSAQDFGSWNCSQAKPGANDFDRGSKNGQEIDKHVCKQSCKSKQSDDGCCVWVAWVWLLWDFDYKISAVKFVQIAKGKRTQVLPLFVVFSGVRLWKWFPGLAVWYQGPERWLSG